MRRSRLVGRNLLPVWVHLHVLQRMVLPVLVESVSLCILCNIIVVLLSNSTSGAWDFSTKQTPERNHVTSLLSFHHSPFYMPHPDSLRHDFQTTREATSTANLGSLGHLMPPSKRHSGSSSVFDFPQAQDPRSREQISTPIPRFSAGSQEDPSLAISYLVLSGGTGCNGIVSAFGSNVAYVLPVSDNGGSSSEVSKVAMQTRESFSKLSDHSRVGCVGQT